MLLTVAMHSSLNPAMTLHHLLLLKLSEPLDNNFIILTTLYELCKSWLYHK